MLYRWRGLSKEPAPGSKRLASINTLLTATLAQAVSSCCISGSPLIRPLPTPYVVLVQ